MPVYGYFAMPRQKRHAKMARSCPFWLGQAGMLTPCFVLWAG
jgi:hypothetical protein